MLDEEAFDFWKRKSNKQAAILTTVRLGQVPAQVPCWHVGVTKVPLLGWVRGQCTDRHHPPDTTGSK